MTRKIAKPKARKPVPKASARKAPVKGTPQDKMEIELLIARYKWLEADQLYQSANAETNEQSDKLIAVHYAEQNKIAAKLAALAPTSSTDIFLLLELVASSLKDGIRTDGMDVDIMQNVVDSFYSVLREARMEAEAKAAANVYTRLRAACDMFERHDKFEAERKAAA